MNTLAEKLPHLTDWQRLNKHLPIAFNIILIIACSYTLSQLTWLLIPAESNTPAPAVRQFDKSPTSQLSGQQQKIQKITDAHLFGVYQSTAATPAQTDAPETRLNLTLKGVLAATPMNRASAIIAKGKNGKEDIYGIGDKVSSATIKEIHTDRVILERSGRFETLRLPVDFSNNTLIQSARSTSAGSPGRPSTPGAMLADIRKKIIRNPTSFGQYAIPIPYNENGRLRGYRLQPQGDNSLFDAVGLSPDDVIVGINDVKLNNPAQGLKALRKLQSARQIDITVLRNGAEIPLHFEIP